MLKIKLVFDVKCIRWDLLFSQRKDTHSHTKAYTALRSAANGHIHILTKILIRVHKYIYKSRSKKKHTHTQHLLVSNILKYYANCVEKTQKTQRSRRKGKIGKTKK